MKIITQLCFAGQGNQAIELYREAFGCAVKTLIHYRDAVQFGWEKPNDAFNDLVYHSELSCDGCEFRVTDLAGEDQARLTGQLKNYVQFDTENEVVQAFQVLSANGTIIRELEKPPYMVIIGEVRDRFGVHWVLMCDYQ